MISKLPGFVEGYFWVQDITASQVPAKMIYKDDMSVLDLCSAPGGKTIEMARVSGVLSNRLARKRAIIIMPVKRSITNVVHISGVSCGVRTIRVCHLSESFFGF